MLKPIPSFPGYLADEHGQIHSLHKHRNFVMKAKPNKAGYRRVVLYKNGKRYWRKVASLILASFVGPRLAGMFACHGINGQLDDSVANLYYATASRNNGLDKRRDATALIGEKNHKAKLRVDQVKEIREIYHNQKIKQIDIARMFGVNQPQISRIILRTHWKHV